MSQHEAWIDLDAGVRDEDAVTGLVAELGADWEVRPFRGAGVDPTAALIALSVPLAVFFRTFLELAAADTYATLKSWLTRLGASNRATVEVRDRDWGQVFRFPVGAGEAAYEVLRGPLSWAMLRYAAELDRDEEWERARHWYLQAADGGEPSVAVEALGRLVAMLQRRGDPDSVREAEELHRRAGSLDLGRGPDEAAQQVTRVVEHYRRGSRPSDTG